MGLTRLRIEDINLYNYIKYEVLGLHFVEEIQNEPLVYDSNLELYTPDYTTFDLSPITVGRGWVPFDEVSQSIDVSSEQSSRVSVVGASSYDINYFLGGIKNPNTTPSSVSFYWNYISVIDGWPGEEPPPIPIAAIDIHSSSKQGFQLGPGRVNSREVDIHVFASSNAERDDIVDVIHESLYNKSISLVDYSEGDYLNYDGSFNTTFSSPSVEGTDRLYFSDVSTRTTNNPADWTNLNKYRSVVAFQMFSYVQS